jgi:hypothetical protein
VLLTQRGGFHLRFKHERRWQAVTACRPVLRQFGLVSSIRHVIGDKGVSDEILISHVGIGKSRQPVQFTSGSCGFAFSHSLGQKRTDFYCNKNPAEAG